MGLCECMQAFAAPVSCAAAAESAGVLAELAAYEDASQRREAAKRSMAAAAQALLRDPEGRLGEVKHILDLLGDSDSQARPSQLCLGVFLVHGGAWAGTGRGKGGGVLCMVCG